MQTDYKTVEKIYIIQPIFAENAHNYAVLHAEAVSLIESAGAAYAGTIYQNIREINPSTFIGSGKLAELRERLDGLEEITILFNGDLSPSQTQNISDALGGRKVIDRTTLILDIFAKNASSNEGKLQIELAQLRYLYPRLKGKGAATAYRRRGIFIDRYGRIFTGSPPSFDRGFSIDVRERRALRSRLDRLRRYGRIRYAIANDVGDVTGYGLLFALSCRYE